MTPVYRPVLTIKSNTTENWDIRLYCTRMASQQTSPSELWTCFVILVYAIITSFVFTVSFHVHMCVNYNQIFSQKMTSF